MEVNITITENELKSLKKFVENQVLLKSPCDGCEASSVECVLRNCQKFKDFMDTKRETVETAGDIVNNGFLSNIRDAYNRYVTYSNNADDAFSEYLSALDDITVVDSDGNKLDSRYLATLSVEPKFLAKLRTAEQAVAELAPQVKELKSCISEFKYTLRERDETIKQLRADCEKLKNEAAEATAYIEKRRNWIISLLSGGTSTDKRGWGYIEFVIKHLKTCEKSLTEDIAAILGIPDGYTIKDITNYALKYVEDHEKLVKKYINLDECNDVLCNETAELTSEVIKLRTKLSDIQNGNNNPFRSNKGIFNEENI